MSIQKNTRDVCGILFLDKPQGLTSNAALQKVKRLYQASKAGHTGSLDPLATGFLPICLGEATKFSQYLLDADKTYQVTAKIGATTTTGDAEGEVITQHDVPDFNTIDLVNVLKNFEGEIQQIPPMYSAIKHKGKPLYTYARSGITIERPSRSVQIHSIQFLNYQQTLLTLSVHCSKGTYIRTLIEDIGKELGTGAHVVTLRRLTVKRFPSEAMRTFEELDVAYKKSGLEGIDPYLLPVQTPVSDWASVQCNPNQVETLRQGQPVTFSNLPKASFVQLLDGHNHFIGLGQISNKHVINPYRLLKF